jgi:hypothetical protein
VIAIVGFFICPPLGAIVALVLANSTQKRIEASGGAPVRSGAGQSGPDHRHHRAGALSHLL